MSTLSLTHAQQQFTAHLSALEDAAGYAFRRRRWQDREEAVAEARAAAWSAWHGLIRKGKDPLAVGVTGIANNAIRYVRNGRRSATPPAAAVPWTSGTRASVAPWASASFPSRCWPGRRRVLAGLAGRGPQGRPGRFGLLPARLRGVAGGLPGTETAGRRAAGRGARARPGGPHRRRLAGAGQPTAEGAGRELAGVPGRGDSRGDGTRLIDRQQRTRSEEDCPLVRPAQAQ